MGYLVQNPILPGFRPDPSICRVGEDYYIVTSTFAYFPGVPIYHSRDLAHWEQIGNVLDRPSQLQLAGCSHSQGIYAPTIRFHDGTYYMITTNISGGGNFIVTANTPEGPWSEPYYLGENAQGIDPSLFFDEAHDGRCYYIGTRPNQKGVRYNGDWEIWVQELDLDTMQLTGESHKVWKGAMHHGIWPEGPHLYWKDGYYYILHAEGGTAENHSVMVARSRNLLGPYEGCPNNPILTHRHLGKEYPVTAVGHGDLVEDGHGNWYMVMLASRMCEGCVNTGRDTWLARVVWENGWPVVNPGVGRLENTLVMEGEPKPWKPQNHLITFEENKFPEKLLMLRNRDEGKVNASDRRGYLRLYTCPEMLYEKTTPAYAAVRQEQYDYQAAVYMEFAPKKSGEMAGMALVCDEENQIHFVETMLEGKLCVCVYQCIKGKEACLAHASLTEGHALELRMICNGQHADFWYREEHTKWSCLIQHVGLRALSTEEAGGFTGCTVGMYATSNGQPSDNYADFRWFSMELI